MKTLIPNSALPKKVLQLPSYNLSGLLGFEIQCQHSKTFVNIILGNNRHQIPASSIYKPLHNEHKLLLLTKMPNIPFNNIKVSHI